jgi:hypothetical protein
MKSENRGRKPIPKHLKKIQISIYISEIDVEKNGGKESLKTKLFNYATTNSERLQQTGTC